MYHITLFLKVNFGINFLLLLKKKRHIKLSAKKYKYININC